VFLNVILSEASRPRFAGSVCESKDLALWHTEDTRSLDSPHKFGSDSLGMT